MANKKDNVKTQLINVTKFTDEEFAAFYNPDITNSMGSFIKATDKAISTVYKCSDPNLCSTDELTRKQWTSSMITLNYPDDLIRNRFLPKIDKCVTSAFINL
jgi:molybdopterin-guanine dinucleotide biosynthesis protein A